jgi:hypothetical protein
MANIAGYKHLVNPLPTKYFREKKKSKFAVKKITI